MNMVIIVINATPFFIINLCVSDTRCTKFYHPYRAHGALYRLCKGDWCQCAEGIVLIYVSFSRYVHSKQLINEKHHTHFTIKAK